MKVAPVFSSSRPEDARPRAGGDDPRAQVAGSLLFDAVWYLSQLGEGEPPADPLDHYLSSGSQRGLTPNPLFDPAWYRERYPDVVTSGLEPLTHYVVHGAWEMHDGRRGRDPHPLFSTSWYLDNSAHARTSSVNPLAHYLVHGGTQRTDPHPLFKTDWYDGQAPDAVQSRSNPLVHYMQAWGRGPLDPHPLFDGAFYAADKPQLARDRRSPLEDYLRRAVGEGGLQPHPLFQPGLYTDQVGDLQGWSALEHHVRHGAGSEVRPHPLFDAAWYLDRNPDARSGPNPPLAHYVMHGARPGVEPNFMFDTAWYARQRGESVSGCWALRHFIDHGGREGSPHPCFDGRWYLGEYRDVADTPRPALEHFLQFGEGEGRAPHPLFDEAWCKESRGEPVSRVRRYLSGEWDGADVPQPLLDEAWYRARYADAGDAPALKAYLGRGAEQGHDPNPFFDTAYYRQSYPDVTAAGLEPLTHFLTYGAAEGRRPSKGFDTAWYVAERRGELRGENPLRHFLRVGYARGAAPNALATAELWPVEIEPDVYNAAHPLSSYLEAIDAHSRAVLAAEVLKRSAPDYGRWVHALRSSLERHPLPVESGPPKVSVILPVYNGVHFTLGALLSIALNPPKAPFEIIVIDNVSTDATEHVMRRTPGIRYIRNAENLGYLRSNNKAVEMARGDFVLLLNNDTLVCPGWMDELLRTFDDNDDVGLAGSKLIYPDGVLQEAGGIIWRDASAWNYGRLGDPSACEVNYTRSVDYCSAAAIMLPRRLWNELDGFDETFVPSYCEDSDLALRVRQRGYSVVYAPHSSVIHFEGMTQGTDTTSGVKAYQVTNTQKLRDRWRPLLGEHQAPGVDLDRAKDRGLRRRVLFLDNCTPQPDEDAGSITVTNLMLLLKNTGFQVTFIPCDNYVYLNNYTKDLQRRGVEVLYGPYCNSVRDHLQEHGARYDLVVMYRPDSFKHHIDDIEEFCPNARTIYHTCDLHYRRMEREAELTRNAAMSRAAAEMKRVEFRAMTTSQVSIVHSIEEQKLLARELPAARTKVFNWAIPIEGTTTPFEDRHDLIFVGGYAHTPNVDAVVFFVEEVMPHVLRRAPDLQFHIVGSRPPPAVLALAGPNVQVHGFVADITPMLDAARIAVAPLRYGAGIKGKIATTMSLGLPTVTTTIGAEGMNLTDEVDVLVADAPADIAAQVLRLYEDGALWRRLSRGGIDYSERAFGFTAAREIFDDILASAHISATDDRPPLRLIAPTSVRLSAPDRLAPLAVVHGRSDYLAALRSPALRRARRRDALVLRGKAGGRPWTFPGWSSPAEAFVDFQIDPPKAPIRAGALAQQLVCPISSLDNRERLLCEHVARIQGELPRDLEMIVEGSRAFTRSAEALLPLGSLVTAPWVTGPRTTAPGAQAEGCCDLIVSADEDMDAEGVKRRLTRSSRALRPGGRLLLASRGGRDRALLRACLAVAERPQDHGFEGASVAIHHAPEFGHLGSGLWIFDAVR